MDIRKTDSKGRISIGEPGTNYYLKKYSNGAVLLEPLATEFVCPQPAPPRAQDYLESLGINPKEVRVDGIDRYGYFKNAENHMGIVRRDWPEDFDWSRFKILCGSV